MTLRFTEKQLKDHQTRIGGNTTKTTVSMKSLVSGYNLQEHIVNGLELGMKFSPGSPFIVTLNHELKCLLSHNNKPKQYERIEQALGLLWLECTAPLAFNLTTAIPLGGYRPNGAGGQIKGEGGKSGYPDLLMDLPRLGYHGLRIEVKKYAASAKPSEDQDKWLTNLAAQGYRSVLCRGHQAVIQVFSTYLGIDSPVTANLPKWCVEYY